MDSKEEVKNKLHFREYIFDLADQIRLRVELIKKAKGKDRSRTGMYNIGIIFNNKMSEILHYYYEREIPFFNDAVLSMAIYDYLDHLNQEGIYIINDYMKHNVKVIDKYSILINDNYPGIDRYKELTDSIYEFDITKDIPIALKGFLKYNIDNSSNFRSMYMNNIDNILEDVKISLEELELTDLNDICEKIIKDEVVRCGAMIYDKHIKLYAKVKSK